MSTKKIAKVNRLSGRIVCAPMDTLFCNETSWKQFSVVIKDKEGNPLFSQDNVTAPSSWSQTAVDLAAYKYMNLKAGETSVKDLVDRIVDTIVGFGLEIKRVAHENSDALRKELKGILLGQYGAFNSPVWFNVGLGEVYKLKGSGGLYYFDEKTNKIIKNKNNFERAQCSACFINSIEDNMMEKGGIYDTLTKEAKIFKYASGSGINYSALRGKNEQLNNGGTSSGLISFLTIFDRSADSVKSGGRTRRSSRMVIVDINHPEIEDFIEWKTKEEKKAQILIQKGGYSSDFNSEIYHTISGQNGNNTVMITDAFMQAVKDDKEWPLINRADGKVFKKVSAKKLWEKIAENAYETGDPGVMFYDTIKRWNPVRKKENIHASNPCAEFVFIDNSACNLFSLNLIKFLTKENKFDTTRFKAAINYATLAQDIIVDFASYPTELITKNSIEYRPIGIGYTNLGAFLMTMGVPYDSDEGRELAASITSLLTAQAYLNSTIMAEEVGPFKYWQETKDDFLEVLEEHARAAKSLTSPIGIESQSIWKKVITRAKKFGVRNSQVSLLMPTGTVGFIMDCDTFGIEPDFSLVKTKKLAGGGHLEVINQSISPALKTLGYKKQEIEKIISYIKQNKTIENAPCIREEHLPVFDCSIPTSPGSRQIAPEGHLKMLAACAPFLSGSISKTCNLPHSATKKDIEDIYYRAWEMGIKNISIYRDGCKLSQPLNEKVSLPVSKRIKLPARRNATIQKAYIGEGKVFVHYGLYENGELGELWIDLPKETPSIKAWAELLAISVSIGLQYGVDPKEYVEAFLGSKFEPSGFVEGHREIKYASSILDFVAKDIKESFLTTKKKKEVEKNIGKHTKCEMCGSPNILTSGTCYTCKDCGYGGSCGG